MWYAIALLLPHPSEDPRWRSLAKSSDNPNWCRCKDFPVVHWLTTLNREGKGFLGDFFVTHVDEAPSGSLDSWAWTRRQQWAFGRWDRRWNVDPSFVSHWSLCSLPGDRRARSSSHAPWLCNSNRTVDERVLRASRSPRWLISILRHVEHDEPSRRSSAQSRLRKGWFSHQKRFSQVECQRDLLDLCSNAHRLHHFVAVRC